MFTRLSRAFVLNITYGIEAESGDDAHIQLAERATEAMAAAGTASTYLVDFIPLLRHVPSWFPGANFKIEAEEWRTHVVALAEKPFRRVKSMFVSQLLLYVL